MNEPSRRSQKPVIYTVIVLGILVLTLLNFWGWLFVGQLEDKLLEGLTAQARDSGELYALLITEKTLYSDESLFSENSLQLAAVTDLLFQFQRTGRIENIFIVSLDQTQFIDAEVSESRKARIRSFPLNDSLFRQSSLEGVAAAERIFFAGEYFITTYAPVRDFTQVPAAVLVVEAPAEIFSELAFFRRALLYMGLTGIAIIVMFSAMILIAIRRLFSAEARLHQQDRLAQLGQMAAMVAHEIRNPLSIIKGSAEVLQKKYADAGDELFDFIPDEINRLNRLVNDFLQFARQRDLNLSRTDANQIAAALVKQIGDPRLVCELDAAAPAVRLDEDAFRQVLLNIIDNARKATGAEGRILLRSQVLQQRSPRLRFEIADSGAGMPPEVLAKIFDPFYSTRATGSGLGLAITRQLVGQMRGEIRVASAPGQGTTVILEFPL